MIELKTNISLSYDTINNNLSVMKIGLLHISDIHIGKTDKNILEFIPKINT